MVCVFYSLFFGTSIECTYFVAIVLIYLNVLLIFVTERFGLIFKVFIDYICEVALAPTAKTMIGATYPIFLLRCC